MNMDIFDYILKVLEMGSISSAAKELYMSQPLLSQKIKQVENELNITIFDRSTTPISLTYTGERFVAAARRIIGIDRELRRELDEISGECKGELSVGISTHRAAQLFPKLMPRFVAKYPLVNVRIVEHAKGRFSDAVAEGDIDMAFVGYDENQLNEHQFKLEYIYLDEDRLAAFAGPRTHIAKTAARATTAELSLAKEDHFVSVRKMHGFRESQNAVFESYGMKPNIALEVDTIELACNLAISCDYVTLLPLTYRDGIKDLAGTSFFCYVLDRRPIKRCFGICYRKNTFLPRYMWDFISLAKGLYHVADV